MKLPVSLTVSIAVVAVAVVGCGAPEESNKDDVDSAASIADGLESKGRDQFFEVREATFRYHDLNNATRDGYVPAGGCAMSPPFVPASQAGGMGYHYVNFALMQKPFEANKPTGLLYEPTSEGGLKLVGVEWIVPVICNGQPWMGTGVPNDPSNPPPFASGTCFPTPSNPPQIFGSKFEGPMPGHDQGMPWHFDKHAWIWKDNPNGIFAQWNPRVDCTP